MTTTSQLKRMIVEYLIEHGTLIRSAFIEHLSENKVVYTAGQLSGALFALSENATIKRVDTGTYELVDKSLLKADGSAAAAEGTVEGLYHQVDTILEEAISSLHALATVNVFNVEASYITELENVKKVIEALEELKKK